MPSRVPDRDRPCRSLRSERGQSIVEFALVFPLLCLLLFGVIEFAKAFNYWNDLHQISADGARFAAVDHNPGPGARLNQTLLAQADSDELRRDASVCIGIADNTVGAPVEVRASYQYDFPIVGGLVRLFDPGSSFGAITMSGRAVMRIERAATDDQLTFQGRC